jgi:hypothetical protein
MLIKPTGKRHQKRFTSTPSRRTLHCELLRLCARIGYSPPAAS